MRSIAASALGLLAAVACPGAVINLTNQGFELGDTSGWSTSGLVSVGGVTVIGAWTVGPAGSNMAILDSSNGDASSIAALESFFGVSAGLLSGGLPPGTPTVGSGIYQDFSGNAGDTVTMFWAYVATDYYSFNDPAFAVVTGPGVEQLTILASIWNGGITVGDYGATGWHSFTYVLPSSGIYRLGFGVVNTGDSVVPGYLMLDSAAGTLNTGVIPEPGTLLLLGVGLLALGAMRRR